MAMLNTAPSLSPKGRYRVDEIFTAGESLALQGGYGV